MKHAKHLTAALCSAAALGTAQAQNFYQFDTGAAGSSVVAVHAWEGGLRLTAGHARWEGSGQATQAALMQTLPLTELPTSLKLSAGAQVVDHRSNASASAPSDQGVGLRLSAEWQPRVAGGQGYVLLERGSVFGSWLGVLQYQPDGSPLGLEWAAAGDNRWYVGRSLVLRYAVPGTRWSARLGWRQQDQKPFIGLSYNGF